MKRKRFTEEQIVGILKEHEAGVPVTELCRKHGVSDASIYKSGRPSMAALRCRTPSG
jgi:putative transposase